MNFKLNELSSNILYAETLWGFIYHLIYLSLDLDIINSATLFAFRFSPRSNMSEFLCIYHFMIQGNSLCHVLTRYYTQQSTETLTNIQKSLIV